MPRCKSAEEKRALSGSRRISCKEKSAGSDSAEEWQVADYLLRQRGLSPIHAARFILEMLESTDDCRSAGENDILRIHRIINMGCDGYSSCLNSVTFRELAESFLRHKSFRRERTLQEIAQYCRRMLRQEPSWSDRIVCNIRLTDCQKLITDCYSTLAMRRKARTILHGMFAYALRKGWCSENPVSAVDLPPPKERPIRALDMQQVRQLLITSLQKKHIPCAPALGVMLWAGIRPYELARLQWSNIHFEDRVISIPPTHSKTGGARQVTMYPVLFNWLKRTAAYRLPETSIIPMSWARRWRELRREAGFRTWEADILRHTFASYHLKYFRNLNELQIDMGHTSPALLRTRYISMDNVTKSSAQEFWHLSAAQLIKYVAQREAADDESA